MPNFTDSYMEIMPHFLNPHRLNLNRNPGRQGSIRVDSVLTPRPGWVLRRRFYPPAQSNSGTNEPPRHITLTPLPNSILGWRFPIPGQSDTGNRQTSADNARVSLF